MMKRMTLYREARGRKILADFMCVLIRVIKIFFRLEQLNTKYMPSFVLSKKQLIVSQINAINLICYNIGDIFIIN